MMNKLVIVKVASSQWGKVWSRYARNKVKPFTTFFMQQNFDEDECIPFLAFLANHLVHKGRT